MKAFAQGQPELAAQIAGIQKRPSRSLDIFLRLSIWIIIPVHEDRCGIKSLHINIILKEDCAMLHTTQVVHKKYCPTAESILLLHEPV